MLLMTESLEILFLDTVGNVLFCSREKAWLSAADRVGRKYGSQEPETGGGTAFAL